MAVQLKVSVEAHAATRAYIPCANKMRKYLWKVMHRWVKFRQLSHGKKLVLIEAYPLGNSPLSLISPGRIQQGKTEIDHTS